MPLSFIMGLSDPSTVRGLEWLCDRGVGGNHVPILRPERLAYVGLRDVDVYERKILHRLRKDHGLFASTMQVFRTRLLWFLTLQILFLYVLIVRSLFRLRMWLDLRFPFLFCGTISWAIRLDVLKRSKTAVLSGKPSSRFDTF